MADPIHQELLRQAVEAARAGDRETARQRVEEVLAEDEENTTAWLLLARLTENIDEKRMAIATVLQLDPGNEKAQALLNKLDDRREESKEEIVPGIPRKQFKLIAGGLAAFVIFMLVCATAIVISSRNAAAEQARAATALALQPTHLAATMEQMSFEATEVAMHMTETQIAIASPTPTPRPTLDLPPTDTPTPLPTGTPTIAPLTSEITGTILGWSGRDLRNLDTLPLYTYSLAQGGAMTQIGTDIGRNPSLFPDGQRVIYTHFAPATSVFSVRITDLNGTQLPSNLDQAPTFGGFLQSKMANLSPDGSQVVLIGSSVETSTDQVYVVNLTGEITQESGVVRLTTDNATYSYPTFSPDGRRVVAVRQDSQSDNPGPDLVIIDVESRAMTQLTSDQDVMRETTPRWSPDGNLIAYAAASSEDQRNHDLYLVAANNPGSGFKLTGAESPSDERFPVFSPNGRYLAFSSNRTGRYNIFVYDLQGQQLFQVTDNQDEDYPSGWVN